MTQTKQGPSAEQLAALVLFAKANGRTWKANLRHAWETGLYQDYAGTEDSASLQQVRNNLGPAWLVRFRLNKCQGCGFVTDRLMAGSLCAACDAKPFCDDVRCGLPSDHTGRCEPDEESDVNGDINADDTDEPDEEDLVTTDDKKFYSHGGPNKLAFEYDEENSRIYANNKVIVLTEGQNTREGAIRRYMDHAQFWPDAWTISDHGNSCRIDLNVKEVTTNG